MDEIFKSMIDACPPLLIFLIAAWLLMGNGCLPKIGGILLIPIGIIALVVWFIL
mgnify:CR=1 FL=1